MSKKVIEIEIPNNIELRACDLCNEYYLRAKLIENVYYKLEETYNTDMNKQRTYKDAMSICSNCEQLIRDGKGSGVIVTIRNK